jgi:hypothetical protein
METNAEEKSPQQVKKEINKAGEAALKRQEMFNKSAYGKRLLKELNTKNQ